jgi:hypothetical protein
MLIAMFTSFLFLHRFDVLTHRPRVQYAAHREKIQMVMEA